MGDVSAEPSMEDILSSIKRIIAEEGDAAASNARSNRRAPRTATPVPRADPAFDTPSFESPAFNREEILELSDQLPGSEGETALEKEIAMSVAEAAEPILSPKSAEASRGSLEALSRMIVKPSEPGADTLEGLVREMIRPMLRDWLDARLPVIVETMVAQEIARITHQPR